MKKGGKYLNDQLREKKITGGSSSEKKSTTVCRGKKESSVAQGNKFMNNILPKKKNYRNLFLCPSHPLPQYM